MEDGRTVEEIRTAFRELAEADRARGRLRALAEYQRLFGGSEALIAAEYATIAADSRDGMTVRSGSSLPPTVVTGVRSASLPGRDLGRIGPYRLVRELGSGGMGRVYHAVCERRAAGLPEGQEVALKVVHAHLTESEGFFKRFLREAEIGKTVRHPNVVRTLDVDAATLEGKPVHFLVMEYVEGQTLRSLLDEVSRVPEALCLHIAREAGKGLSAIHGIGVVHRDFKPENVLITKDQVVKVMDLGVARLADEAVRLSMTGAFVGTLPYAAPEQFLGGGKDLDGRADLYALGLTLYELSTGQPAFPQEDLAALLRRRLHEEPRPPSAINPQLSPYFEEVVKTLVARDREKRFASAAAMGEVLERGEGGPWWRRRSGEIRAETKRPLRRIRIPRDTALFGRVPEMTKLRALWEMAKAGEGRVVLLEGEAGIGKSRLVDELAGLLHHEGEEIHFLFGSYPPGGAATAVGALSTAYREQFGAEDLEGTLAAHLAAVPLVIPSFAALLRGEPPPKGAEPLSKESLQTAFVEATRSLARDLPTVILVDDLHFGPEEGKALFMALALAIPGHRVLLVGTSRPGLPAEWTSGLDRLGHASRLSLGRLGPKDLQGLLAEAFGSERLAEELGGRIAAKSDGNPFFVFEILRSLREGGALRRREDGTWVKTSEFREIEIPSSVTDLVRARIGRLSEEERNLLDVAACLGFEFDPLLAGEILGLGRIPVLQRLAGIEKAHRLVRSAGRRFLFDHHQVQEVLHAALPDLLREEYHGAAGEALERRVGATGGETGGPSGMEALEICQHFLAGGRGAAADRHLDAAVLHLQRAHHVANALDLLDRAFAVIRPAGLRRVELRRRQIERLERTGRKADWKAALDDAFATAEASGDPSARIRVRLLLASFLNQEGDPDREREVLDETLGMARSAGDKGLEGRVYLQLGQHFHARSLSADAMECHEKGLALAIEAGDEDMKFVQSASIGAQLTNMGRYEESLPYTEGVLAHAREKGLRHWEQALSTNTSITMSRLGRFEEARILAARSLELSSGIGDARGETHAMAIVSHTLWNLGELAEALAFRERQVERATALGQRAKLASACLNLGWHLGQLGDIDRAEELALRALQMGQGFGDADLELNVLHNRGELAEAREDREEAERFYRQAIALAEGTSWRRRLSFTVLSLAGIHLVRGEVEEARRRGEEALALAREFGAGDDIVAALAVLATLPGGDPGPAVAAFRSLGRRYAPVDMCRLRFLLWRATGNREHLAEAHGLLTVLRDRAPPEYRESLLTRVPLFRGILAAWEARGDAPGVA